MGSNSATSRWSGYNHPMKFDGKAFAKKIEQDLTAQVAKMPIKPKIVSVLVGNDPASVLYTNLKKAAAERIGVAFEAVNVSSTDLTEQSLYKKIAEVASKDEVSGVMVQLPVPGLTKDEQEYVITAIPPSKDVDGLIWQKSQTLPATVLAIQLVMDEIAEIKQIQMKKKKIAVVGAAGAIGRPLCLELKSRGLTVIEIERRTPNPSELTRSADIVISCVGQPGLITKEMVRDGVIVIDVGMSEIQIPNPKFSNSQINTVVGDMTQEVYAKAELSVEVPGGVGPVTIVSLIRNVLEIVDRAANT